MSFERKITVSADTSQMDRAFENSGKSMSDSFGKVADAIEDIQRKTGATVSDIGSKVKMLESETSNLFKGLIKDSDEYGKSSKERLKYLNDEINLLQTASKVEEQRAKVKARERYEEKISSGTNEKKAREDYMKEVSGIESQSQMSDLQNRILKQKYEQHRILSNNESGEDDGGGSGGGYYAGGRSRGDRGRSVGSRVLGMGGTAMNAAASAAGFGAVLSIAGFVGKMIQEGAELQSSQSRNSAMGIRGGGSIQGLKTADALEYIRRTSPEIGSGDANEAIRQGRIEKGTGMDLGTITGFNASLRSETNGKKLSDATVEMLSIMKKSGLYNINKDDFTQVHELLGKQNELNILQASNLEKINVTTSSQAMASFATLGGSFKDTRAVSTISSLNQGITDPDNEYKRAFLMRSIKGRNKDATLMDVEMSMEEGVFKKGQFKAIMEDLVNTFEGDMLVKSISKIFNLSLHAAKSLKEGFESDPNRFNTIGSEAEIRGKIAMESKISSGGSSQMEGMLAEFNNWFADKGSDAINYIADKKNAYDSGGFGALMSSFASDIKDAIAAGMNEVLIGLGLKEEPYMTESEYKDRISKRELSLKKELGYDKMDDYQKRKFNEEMSRFKTDYQTYASQPDAMFSMGGGKISGRNIEDIMRAGAIEATKGKGSDVFGGHLDGGANRSGVDYADKVIDKMWKAAGGSSTQGYLRGNNNLETDYGNAKVELEKYYSQNPKAATEDLNAFSNGLKGASNQLKNIEEVIRKVKTNATGSTVINYSQGTVN